MFNKITQPKTVSLLDKNLQLHSMLESLIQLNNAKDLEEITQQLNQLIAIADDRIKVDKAHRREQDEAFMQACADNELGAMMAWLPMVSSFAKEIGLAIASFKGHLNVVKILLNAGVPLVNHHVPNNSLSINDYDKPTCFTGSPIGKIRFDMTNKLHLNPNDVYWTTKSFKTSADLTERDRFKIDEKYDPIHQAICGDHPEILRLLLPYAAKQLHNYVASKLPKWKGSRELMQSNLIHIRSEIINTEFKSENVYLFADLWHHHSNKAEAFSYVFAMNRWQPLLIEAIYFGSTQCALLLLTEFDANPSSNLYNYYYDGGWHFSGSDSSQGKIECSALALAAKKNNAILVKALLKAGANSNQLDCNGKTPAELTTDTNIQSLLLKANPEIGQNNLNSTVRPFT